MKGFLKGVREFGGNFVYALSLIMGASRLYFFLAALMCALSGLYGVVQAVFLKEILNGLTVGAAFARIALCAALILLGLFVNKVVSRLLMALNRIVTDKLSYTLEHNILQAMDHVTAAQMDDPKFQNRVEQTRTLIKNQPNSVFMNMFGILTELVGLAGYFVILTGFHWAAPWILLATAVLLFFVNNQYEENVMAFLFSMSPERRRMGYCAGLITGRDSFEEVRTYGSGEFLRAKYRDSMDRQIGKGWAIFRTNAVRYALAALASYLGCGAVYLWILARAHGGALDLGSVAMLLSACVGIQGLCTELVDGCAVLPASLAALGGYRRFLREMQSAPEGAKPDAGSAPDPRYAVQFDRVTFAYPGAEKPVLRETSFAIRPNTTAALVGVNGAGKTTLVKLMMGLYDSYEGHIYLNGRDSRAYTEEERRELLAVMFQNYMKPSFTLEEAVSMGLAADGEAVRRALDDSRLTDSQPLETPLTKSFSPDGWVPSGGQWQKIALARMLVRNTPMYALDEPSAALDPQSELEVFQTLAELRGEKTILFITHRLASITDADEVIFLSPGGAARQGTHRSLMDGCAEYNALYSAQADRYQK